MCIAIYKPDNKQISRETLAICYANNSDGAGFAFAKDGKLTISKGFFTFDDFWNAYSQIPENVPAVIHFRIGTSGKKDAFNCHPWEINEDVCLIHNGVMGDFTSKDCPQSDTGNFVEHFIRPFFAKAGNKCFLEDFVKYAVYKVIGNNNKIIFFDKDGSHTIINADEGEYVDEVWFSNGSYKEERGKKKGNSCNVNVNVLSPGLEGYETGKYGGKVKHHGYIEVKTGRLLSEKEIGQFVKRHRKNAKQLASCNILKRVELTPTVLENGGDGQDAYNNWLARRSVLNAIAPLEGRIPVPA